MAGATLLCLGVTAGQAAIPATLAVQGALGPDHRDTGGGNDPVVNLRATIRNGALDNLYQEDHCGVVTVGRDGEFGILLGETLPVVLPFDEQYDVLIDACYDKHGCDGITNVDECDPDYRVQVVVMLDPVAYAHRAREADAISGSFLFNGDVAGPYFNLQLQPAVVGTPEIADGSVTLPKLGFDPATQLELDAEAAARAAADTAETNARTAADATLQSNINAEAAARAAADTAEANARTAADASEAAARAAGDNHAGDVAGPSGNLQIQSGTVGSAEVADNSLGPADIADGLGINEIDETQFQRRVLGCPIGESIRVVMQDGTVVCEVDDTYRLPHRQFVTVNVPSRNIARRVWTCAAMCTNGGARMTASELELDLHFMDNAGWLDSSDGREKWTTTVANEGYSDDEEYEYHVDTQ